ncbi:MAG: adenylyl-sulfate kinase, partial [Planctomycetes bacterium]|nr:adenylyl-sulfate kinase [Planctomycetota bacterium]
GFDDSGRVENIRRISEVCKLFFESGSIVACSFISPFKKERDFARSLVPADRFIEIYVKCDIDTCKDRDPKGLYEKAMNGEIKDFTGINSPYEEPVDPEITIDSSSDSIEECASQIIDALLAKGIIK